MNPSPGGHEPGPSPVEVEVDRLVAQLANDACDLQAAERLQHLVCTDELARRRYIRGMTLIASLQWGVECGQQSPGQLWWQSITGDETTPAEPQAGNRTSPAPQVPAATLGNEGVWEGLSVDRPLHLLQSLQSVAVRSWVMSALAVALVFYTAFALLSWDMRPVPPGPVADNGERKPSAETQEEKTTEAGQAIVYGEPREIDAGSVSLKLARGVLLEVYGPARWAIDDENRVSLYRGGLKAHVPAEAIGFTLNTPTATIVDLGTEFHAEVNQDLSSQVLVTEGSVQLLPGGLVTPQTPSVPITLKAGEGRRTTVDPATRAWVVRHATERDFARGNNLPPAHGPFYLPPSQILIEDSKPQVLVGTPGTHFQPAADDLLQTSLRKSPPSLVANDRNGRFSLQSPEALANGRLYGDEPGSLFSSVDSYSSTQPVEFYLDTSNAPDGYDIEQIETITGWAGARVGQNYLVFFRRVGKTYFESTPAVRVNVEPIEDDGKFYERKVTIRGRNGQALAVGVDAISFLMLERATESGMDVFREIDVIGQPRAVPPQARPRAATP